MTGAGTPVANNTVRQRLSTARTFYGWLLRHGIVTSDPTVECEHLKSQHPKTYGKKQADNPARFLTADEATALLDACKDGTWIGSRDQLIIRLGLLGLRCREIVGLRWGHLHSDGRLHWIGKRNKPRTVTPGPTLTAMLARWRTHYERQIGRPVTADDPIICPQVLGAARQGGPRRINYGRPMAHRTAFLVITDRAKSAGLGHVAPHDLRRTAASILHNAKTSDGGHLYDLLDIQKVLDHSDPATTMRSYIEQMDTETKDRAGRTLDL